MHNDPLYNLFLVSDYYAKRQYAQRYIIFDTDSFGSLYKKA